MSIGREDYQERRKAHIEHLEERADKARAESDAAFQTVHDISSAIPAGQPVLVGHHSEKRHRRALERMDRNMEKGIAASKKAAYYDRRAQSARDSQAISSDDPDAVERLEAKLAGLEEKQVMMKAVNACYRKHKTLDDCPELTSENRREIEERWAIDWYAGIPFPPYELSNNNAEISRIKKRLEELRRVDEMPHAEITFDGGIIVINEDINRVQILFNEKPDEETRAKLKRSGFRWSRTESAWQMYRSPDNFRNACRLCGVTPSAFNTDSDSDSSGASGSDESAPAHEAIPAPAVELDSVPCTITPTAEVIAASGKVEELTVQNWKVQLAKTIEDAPIPAGKRFWLTQKCNGIRGTYYRGQITGRNGRAYAGLEHITKVLEEKGLGDYVLDGELTLADPGDLSDSEAFRKAAGLVRSRSSDKSSLALRVFDIIPTGEFDTGRSRTTYAARRELLDKLAERFTDTKAVQILPVLYTGTDQSVIEPMLDRIVAEGKEGLMANLDTPYQKKRNSGILKIKRFDTIDLPVVRCEEGTGANAGKLGAFVVAYNGCEVGVGTGLTQEQREEYWARREELVGKIIEIKYKEESTNQSGGVSLQFPVFVALREDKNDMSVSRTGAAAMEKMAKANFGKPQETGAEAEAVEAEPEAVEAEPEAVETEPEAVETEPEAEVMAGDWQVWRIGGREIHVQQLYMRI